MKKSLLILAVFLCFNITNTFAQAPQSFSYQAIVRDASNIAITNQNVGIKILILESSQSGNVVYSESHNVITSPLGLVNLKIGDGSTLSGDFSTVSWGSSNHYVRIELDENGGTNYQLMGTSQLLSVPYALYSESSGSGSSSTYTGGNGISISGTVITNSNPDQVVSLTGTGSTTVSGSYPNFTINSTDNVNDLDFSTSNEIQTISQSGTDITLSNGGGTFSILDGTAAIWQVTGSDIYRLNTNVGIGHNAPINRLHVIDTLSNTRINSGLFEVVGGSTAGSIYRGLYSGIQGTSGFNRGIQGTSDGVSSETNSGVNGYALNGFNNYGVEGVASSTTTGFNIGVRGDATESSVINRGVYGNTSGTGDFNQGLFGRSDGVGSGLSNSGVLGYATGNTNANYSIYGISDDVFSYDYAGYFVGDVTITGNLNVTGNVSKGAGTFKIDHPLDPENKYLVHSFVESPEMLNIYSGNTTTGSDNEVIVTLPNYFLAANKDFRYQLTVIGSFAQAIILKEIANNKFVIATNEPNVKVSWQVTAVRADPYAEENRILPEVEKTEKGTYLHPELYNQGPESSESFKHKKAIQTTPASTDNR